MYIHKFQNFALSLRNDKSFGFIELITNMHQGYLILVKLNLVLKKLFTLCFIVRYQKFKTILRI